MKTQEIIAGLRKLSQQGSQYRRTVCRLAADKLEQMQAEFKTIREDGLCAVCAFDDIAPPGCENDCCFSWRGKEEPEDSKGVEIDQFNRWIPVTERLPELIPCNAGTAYSEAINVLTDGRKVLTAIWDGTTFLCDADYWEAWDEKITHWTPVLLPLPEPPKED